jgi:NADH-quinone oxidoreductase subunit N
MTPHFDFVALIPELIAAVTFAVVLIVDLVISDRWRPALVPLSLVGCIGGFVVTVVLGATGHRSAMFGGTYVVDNFALLAKAMFFASAAGVLLFGLPTKWKGEYCELILASLLGMVMLASSRDIILFFVSFELFALPGYLLTGWNKKTEKGAEAALKYYLLGAFASAVMLYGLSFLFGEAGGTSFAAIASYVSSPGDHVALMRIAIFMVIVGMAFKVSAVPLHFWAPDAYQGAPIPVAAFLSVTVKIAGFVALLEVLTVALPGARAVWAPIVFGLAIATMVVGNLVALKQSDAVRLLAYSAIAQSGYILIPLAVAHGSDAQTKVLQSTFEYLAIYAVANLGAFAAVLGVARVTKVTSLDSFDGLFHRSPALASALAVFILSLAGIPPLGGWFAKFIVVRDAISVESVPSVTIALVAVLTTAIGLVYYLSFIRRLWLDPAGESADTTVGGSTNVSPSLAVVFGLAAVALVVSGVLPAVVTDLGGWTSLHK